MNLQPGSILPLGPFTVSKAWISGKMLVGILWLVGMLGIGIGIGVLASQSVTRLLFVAETAKIGEVTEEVGYEGEVETTNIIFMNYKLAVDYYTPDGGEYSMDVDFNRFFTGPDDNDPVWVLYDPNQPSRAVLSWELDSLGHGWIMVVFMFGIALVIVGAGVVLLLSAIKAINLVTTLASSGKLQWCEVVTGTMGSSADKQLTLSYLGPKGAPLVHTYPKAKSKAPYFSEDLASILVLTDGEKVQVLQKNSIPLIPIL